MTITPGYYKTRDGRKARVLCVDAPGKYPCVGYIDQSSEVRGHYSWALDGVYQSGNSSASDLIEPWTEPKPKKQITLRRAFMGSGDHYKITIPVSWDLSGSSDFISWLDEEPMVIEVEEE